METHAYYVHFHSTLHQWTDKIGCSMDILMLTVLDLFLEVVSDITCSLASVYFWVLLFTISNLHSFPSWHYQGRPSLFYFFMFTFTFRLSDNNNNHTLSCADIGDPCSTRTGSAIFRAVFSWKNAILHFPNENWIWPFHLRIPWRISKWFKSWKVRKEVVQKWLKFQIFRTWLPRKW